ncbi:MAG: hypothetical protein ACLR43_14775 [Faecalibacillus faecis]
MNFVSTVWALLPPIIAIVFALKTKEVYFITHWNCFRNFITNKFSSY